MPRMVNWLARAGGLAWLGLLAFLIAPPPGLIAALVQIAGYDVLGLGFLAWALIDLQPAAAPYRARRLGVALGVMAVAAG
ncbi:MAG TPA: hypothetical protein VH307_27540, partial [Streptosporangiaceae bacterium]|nr:hypothetical protein [Streptosporangiaceae bacterium]